MLKSGKKSIESINKSTIEFGLEPKMSSIRLREPFQNDIFAFLASFQIHESIVNKVPRNWITFA